VSESAADRAAAVRRGVGVFAELRRGILEVTGGDRSRWLNGMISAEVADLAPGASRSGAYALLLSPKGRILADLHVTARESCFWLETDAEQLPGLLARLDRYVIADDVSLTDVSDDFARIGIEGPAAPALVETLVAAPLSLAPEAWAEAEVAGATLAIAAWGWSGERAFQLFVPAHARAAVLAAIEAAAGVGLVHGDADTLEVLRIEAGVPRVGAELDEEVFPAEAGLIERAVSLTKGCFTGQEIVARLESRGQVNHRLVALRFEGEGSPEVGATLTLEDGKPIGEVTSVCLSSLGAIGLGYARLPHDAPGTRLLAGSREVRVAALSPPR
jgi:aminomethyltransferase